MNLHDIDNPAFRTLVSSLLEAWPEHEKFLMKSFDAHSAEDIPDLTNLSEKILSLVGNQAARFVTGYRWMCTAFVEEEIYFRRNGRYRCSSFSDAFSAVYDNPSVMARYMDGLLLSQLFWSPHAKGFFYFKNSFLPRLPDQYRLLEIGCGHGLLLTQAASDIRSRGVVGWDVSAESLRHSAETLQHFGCAEKAEFVEADIFADSSNGNFDAVVLSELLEHLENPLGALSKVCGQLRPGGLIYINIPVNSPAPDHIYLWRNIDEVEALVRQCGLTILHSDQAPMSGYTLSRALALNASINCLVTAQKPNLDRATWP